MLAGVEPVFDFLLIEVNELHDGNQLEPQVLQCWVIRNLHEVILKSGVDGH